MQPNHTPAGTATRAEGNEGAIGTAPTGTAEASLESLEDQHVLQALGLRVGHAMLLFAGLVGLTAGAAAFVFYWLINVTVHLFLQVRPHSLSTLQAAAIVLSPGLGGLACGLLLHYFAPDARGGVPEVIYALHHRDGYIRTRVGLFKTIASAICIGSGGSAGREGPVVQIGASVGSSLARLFRVTRRRAQLLVACGAAGGIAAVFNAPIAGAIFVAEIITGRFEMRDLSLLFTASAMGAVIARILLQDHATFQVPAYHLISGWGLVAHAVLGVLCALVGHLFILTLHGVEHQFERIRLHPAIKPAIGGLIVGVLGLYLPEILGSGGEVLESLLRDPPVAWLLLLWMGAKLISTSFTLGSGGSGGDLMPSLFLGATLGGAVGHVVHRLFPVGPMPPGGYALVGAAALFAGVAHAPVTAIILGIEMGRDYGVVLPLMVACSMSTLVASSLRSTSLYTFKLRRRGVDLERIRGTRVDLLDSVRVGEVMTGDVPAVPPDLPLPDLLDRFASSGHHGFAVVDGDRLQGIVTLVDAQEALDRTGDCHVRDIATRDPIVCYPSDTLNQAIRRLGTRQVGRIPVVSEEDPERVVGLLRRSDIVKGYSIALGRERAPEGGGSPSRGVSAAVLDELARGGRLVDFTVSPLDWYQRKRVRDLQFPPGCVLVALRRGRRTLVPNGATFLRVGDQLTAFVTGEAEEAFSHWLSAPPTAAGIV